MAHLKKRDGHLLRTGLAGLGHLVRGCINYICGNHTCTTRIESGVTIRTYDGVDLDPCECIDADTGDISTFGYIYTVHLTGTAAARSGTLGGTPYTLTAVDISGSYTFTVTFAGTPCIGTEAPFEYKLHSEFIGTHGGSDYYAMVWLRGGVGGQLLGTIQTVFTGDPEPTSGGGSIYDKWDFDTITNYPCGVLNLCICYSFQLEDPDGLVDYVAGTPDFGVVGFDLSDCEAVST